MLLPLQSQPVLRTYFSAKALKEFTVSSSQYLPKDAGDAIRCQICCRATAKNSDPYRCNSEDNPRCICP
jgi:hypothetical protein